MHCSTQMIRRRHIALPLGLLLATVLGMPQNLCAADTTTDITLTKDSLTVNKGTYVCKDDSLKTLSQYTIAGTFFSNRYVSPKFPCGGILQIVSGSPAAPRLNPQATMAFHGGYLFLDAGKAAVTEQVRQIQFQSGMSEIRLENAADGSKCTTLMATDPAASLVRNQGATVMVGGDQKRSQAGLNTTAGVQVPFSMAMGVAEKLLFAGGMDKYMKGAGGPAGATNRSVIPWMTIGSYLQPAMGGVATYDPEKGVRCLAPSEYDKKLQGTPDRNIWVESIDLGERKTQTVNALVFIPYFNSQIGAGSTLTITSGFLQFGQRGPSTIGSHPQGGDYISTGTINFGPAEGVIWTCFETEWGPNIIGPVIAGSGGLTIAGSNTLILQGANTYTGRTCVCDGTLQIGDVFPTKARIGNGDLEVAAGASVRIMPNTPNAIADTATVTLRHAGASFCGVMELPAGVSETVAGLVMDDKPQPAGTYGSTASAASHKMDNYFSGAGILTVTGP